MDDVENSKFDSLSIKLTKTLSTETKKKGGIFFTPPITIKCILETHLKPYLDTKIKTILEPSCGSCEFIKGINSLYPSKHFKITAIENNKTIYQDIEQKYKDNKNITILNKNFLKYNTTTKYDLIIGNPPYFVLSKEQKEKKDTQQPKKEPVYDIEYNEFFDGRPNIFILFILKSLKLLEVNGILSFVVPKSFINCLYYNKTRNEIYNNYEILNIFECNDSYLETQQETIVIILKHSNTTHHKNENARFILTKGEYIIFGTEENVKLLTSFYESSKTLHELHFKVNIGTVVWNQCKSILVDKPEIADANIARLIYSSDIVKNELTMKKYKNSEVTKKRNYIKKKGINDVILLINRGYGKGTYKFNYCLLENETNYLIENHLICIRCIDTKLKKEDIILLLKKIIKSFENTKTQEFIKLYFGNSAINISELNHILPIYGM